MFCLWSANSCDFCVCTDCCYKKKRRHQMAPHVVTATKKCECSFHSLSYGLIPFVWHVSLIQFYLIYDSTLLFLTDTSQWWDPNTWMNSTSFVKRRPQWLLSSSWLHSFKLTMEPVASCWFAFTPSSSLFFVRHSRLQRRPTYQKSEFVKR